MQAMTADQVFEIDVDLAGMRLGSVTARTGAGSSITLSEIEGTSYLVLSS